MPRRTNIFQKLILLINKQIAGQAKVTESALLPDAVTGKMREVDILIEGEVGVYKTVIGIECIDWRRKADVTWIEKMYQKHQNLATDKLVAVSRLGFTSNANKKARFYNIETLSFENALGYDWMRQLRSIEMIAWDLEIVSNEIQLTDTVEDATIETPIRFCDPSGKQHDLLRLLRSDIVSSLELTKELLKPLSEREHAARLCLAIDLQTGKFREWYVPDSKGNRHKLKWYRMGVRVSKGMSIANVQHASYLKRNVAFSKLTYEKENTVIAFVQGEKGEVNISADVVSNKEKHEKTVYARYMFINNKPLLVKIDDRYTVQNRRGKNP